MVDKPALKEAQCGGSWWEARWTVSPGSQTVQRTGQVVIQGDPLNCSSPWNNRRTNSTS